ncbi:MerR family DNA-binding transcriptional regulator [Solirubrobacter taibaiensis]|nr:MerR family DNA-binding transcriptional regulator [Solirubrobacter taibaiensis]
MAAPVQGLLRIGPFSRRVGVSVSVLRAWESRYGLFTPLRTAGGFRLYSFTDEARAQRMLEHLSSGLAARESASLALAAGTSVGSLVRAWETFDATSVHAALDELLAQPDPASAVSRRVLPALVQAGDAWAREELGPARIHFAGRLLEARLLALGGRWHEGPGPLALLGCGPGEQHSLGPLTFALALHRRGWRIAWLGADTPVEGFEAAARSLRPDAVVVSFTMAWTFTRARGALRSLAAEQPLRLCGPAVNEAACADIGARRLTGDPALAFAQV